MVGRRFAGPTLHKFTASPRKQSNRNFREAKADTYFPLDR